MRLRPALTLAWLLAPGACAAAAAPVTAPEPVATAPASSIGLDGGSAPSPPAPSSAAPALPPPRFVAAVPAEPPSPFPAVTLTSPKKDQIVPPARAAELEVTLKLSGWALDGGRQVRLVLDNRASLVVTDASRRIRLADIDPSPEASAPGQHILVALLAGPTGEWVKPLGKRVPAAVVAYFVGPRTTPAWKEGSPLLVYAGPTSRELPEDGVLVDFYVLGAELGWRAYSVRAAVTGPGLMTGEAIHTWTPWRVVDARPGDYTVRLELYRTTRELGESSSSTTMILSSRAVEGAWSTVTRDFHLVAP